MIDIKSIKGEVLYSVLATSGCMHTCELMTTDCVRLSFNLDSGNVIPAGSYIEYNGQKYSLLAPYSPHQKSEIEYTYEPEFQSQVMGWSKKPFFYIGTKNKETDWELTDTASNFISVVLKSIKDETGLVLTSKVDASLLGTKHLSFQSTDIFSALNSIANAWDTEWWVESNVLHLSKCEQNIPIVLEVGKNINVPSIEEVGEYYTRYYAFGSTRNITNEYQSATTSHIVRKRLRLPSKSCPNGYKDIRPNLLVDEVFVKTLVFDEIYPRAIQKVSKLTAELKPILNGEGGKIQIGEDKGTPIFDMYSIYRFEIANYTLNKNDIIEGQDLSVRFTSGALNGRDFKLSFINNRYEIIPDESEGFIIPNINLAPKDGDSIVLYNIKMPSEYVSSAEERLEEALDNHIKENTADLNVYTFRSNPIEFTKEKTKLVIGQKIIYKNGDYSFETRVTSLKTQLDYLYDQEIKIGNNLIKGTIQELKEEVVNVNKNLEVIKALNSLSNDIQNAYGKAQRELAQGIAKWGKLWSLETYNGIDYVSTHLPIVTQEGITMYGAKTPLLPSKWAGLPLDNSTLKWRDDGVVMVDLTSIATGSVNKINVNGKTYESTAEGIVHLPDFITKHQSLSPLTLKTNGVTLGEYTPNKPVTLDIQFPKKVSEFTNDKGFITTSALVKYATQEWVNGRGFITKHQDLSLYAKSVELPTKLSQLVNDSGYLTKHQSLSGYAKESWVNEKGYLTGIAKSQIENVLTGDITSHTHNHYYGSKVSRVANTVLAGPNGASGSASFRKLMEADIPSLSIAKVSGLQTVLNEKALTAHTHSFSHIKEVPTTATRWPSWLEVTGKPSAFNPSSHSHNYINSIDSRNEVMKPNDKGSGVYADFRYTSKIDNPSSDTYTGVITFKSYGGTNDTSGGGTHQLGFNSTGLYHRKSDSVETWYQWRRLAFTDDNVLSASNLETARTIALTGSVTGSIVFDGSKNVSINTVTNHSHTYSQLTAKPTTLAGYGITDTYTKAQADSKYLGVGATSISSLKLQTARSLWGQNFNGTSGVSGNMSGVGNLSMTGSLKIKDKEIKYDPALGAFVIDADLIVTGGISMYKK